MPLNISRHKSYHVYNRDNIERVRRDEEAARLEQEEQDQHRRLGGSQDRLSALRAQRAGESPPSASGSATVDAKTDSHRHKRSRTQQEPTAEHGARLADLVAKKAWYDDPDLRSHKERQRTQEQALEAAYKDSTIKSSHDPLKAVEGFLAQKEQLRRKEEEQQDATAQQSSLSSYSHYVRQDWGKQISSQEQDFRARPQLFDPGGTSASTTTTDIGTEGGMTDAVPHATLIKQDPDGPDANTGPLALPAHATDTAGQAAPQIDPDSATVKAEEDQVKAEDDGDPLAEVSLDSNDAVPRPRESMYPVLLGEMIDTVLDQESYLFDASELTLLLAYASLPYEARYLFSRLIQRRDTWMRVGALRTSYASEGTEGIDIESAIAALTTVVEGSSASRFLITHADAGEAAQQALLELLTLDELKSLAKRMHTSKPGTTKASIVKALLTTRSQGTLMSAFAKKSPQSTPKKHGDARQLSLQFTTSGKKASQSNRLADEVTALLGLLVRVDPAARSLIDRVALVFYRGSMLGGTALTTAVLARSRRRNYPEYHVQRTSNVFPSRENLVAFEDALRVEAEMEELLQWGDNSETTWNKALQLFESIWPVWKRTVEQFDSERGKQDGTWNVDASDSLTYHRMRFHAGWPQTRVVYKGAGILARFKLHTREQEVLQALLGQRYFRRGKRGEWYDRLALITAMYNLASSSSSDSTSTAAKTQSKMAALSIAVSGIEDPDTHLIYHDTLQRRITRLENQLPIPKSQKHDFSYAKLKQCVERTYLGVRLDCMDYGQDEKQKSLVGSFVRRDSSPLKGSNAGAGTSASPSPAGSRFTVRAPMRKLVKVEQRERQGSTQVKAESPSRSRSQSPVKKAVATPSRPASSFFMKRDASSSSSDLLLSPHGEIPPAPAVSPSPTPDLEDGVVSTRREKRTSMASVWRGPLDGEPCRVEDVVLQQYQMQGYEGYHDEGGLLKMLFTLCLWDVIFCPASLTDIFETPYQRAPLDLGQDSFSITRGAQLHDRLQSISSGSAPSLVTLTDTRERERKTWAVGCKWDSFPLSSLLSIATLLPGPTLATIFTMMAEEWEHCSSGMPDLIVWNETTGVVRLCEVKSINDRLSETQKVWIDVLLRAGVEVEVSLVRETGEDAQRPELSRKRSSSNSSSSVQVDSSTARTGSPLKRRVS